MRNFTAYWNTEKFDTPVLRDVTLEIKKGQLHGIIGGVGSGKSSLLNCILGEVPRFKGEFELNFKSVAYVEQEPFIKSGTIEDNITFGRPMINEHY